MPQSACSELGLGVLRDSPIRFPGWRHPHRNSLRMLWTEACDIGTQVP